MAITGKDSLLEASAGVAITAHTPSGSGATGGAWAAAVGHTALTSRAGGGFKGAAATAGSCYQAGNTASGAVYAQVIATVATGEYGGVELFADTATTGGSGYLFYFEPPSGLWVLYKYSNGAGDASLIASWASPAFVADTPKLLRLERAVSGSDAVLSPFIDGVPLTPFTDTSSPFIGSLIGGLIVYGAPGSTFASFEAGNVVPSGSFTVAPGTVGTSASAVPIVLTGTGTSWDGGTVFSVAGGTGASVASAVVASTTSATIQLIPGTAVATLTISAAGADATLQAVNLIRANDAGYALYGRWGLEGTEQHTISNGATCEFAFPGTTLKLLFNVAGVVNFPMVAYWIDGVGPVRTQLDATGLITATLPPSVYSADTPSAHRCRFVANVESEHPVAYDDWTSRRDALKWKGAVLGTGLSLIPVPTSPNTIEFLGDSITAGLRALYTSTDGVAYAAPEAGWPFFAAELLGLKAIVNGHGGQGINGAGTDGTPAANAAFNYVYAGKAWNPTAKPAVVVVYQGSNDVSISQANYQTFLATIRTAYPAAMIFAVAPSGSSGGKVTAINAAVAALDANIFALDYSALTFGTTDSVHLDLGGMAELGAKLATDLQAQFVASGFGFQAATGGGGGATVVFSPYSRSQR